jgi:SNF2 family DNA or RNA helicase
VGRGIYPVYKSSDGISPFAKYTVVSYDLLRNEAIHRALLALDWDLFICDEAHYLKEVSSKRSKAALGSLDGAVEGVASKSARLLPMTGTPLPNRPRECYNLARHVCWDAIDWLSEDAFIRRFNPSTKLMTGHTLEYNSRLPELRARLRCNMMVRRRRRAVLKQLPAEFHEITHVDPNGAIRKVLKTESLLDISVEDWEDLDFQTRGHIAAVRHEMGVAKVSRVIEHVNMLMDGGLPKLFLVAYHRKVMDLLAEKLDSYGVATIRGGQTPLQRDKEKARFIDDPDCKVLIGQINAAGEALDGLQKVCWHGCFAEASWVSKDNEQVCGRLIRMGQGLSVYWQYLVAPGSLDEKILGRSIQKGQIVRTTLDG